MKANYKNALKLAQQIEVKYSQLNTFNGGFFDLYHDDLKTQSNCAYDELDDLVEYLSNKKKFYGYHPNQISGLELAEISMQNLRDTLAYVTSIIDVQNQLNNCPKSIYG
jgi:hypothetical protein